MYKQGIYTVMSNRRIAADVYRMVLSGDTQYLDRPGQFINIKLSGLYLRRPISVCDWDKETITIIYKVVGEGTARMAAMTGGEGAMPSSRKLLSEGVRVIAVLGFNQEDQIFGYRDFAELGVPVCLTTVDGSVGVKGFVTDALKNFEYDFYFTCGPEPMLRAVWNLGKERGVEGLLSFEARMGCGFGACMGCSCETIAGPKRICVEGPVMKSGEVLL